MRINFPAAVKDALAKRVGVRCSNPVCIRPTSGPQTNHTKAMNLGVAAHITAAAKGAARYDATLTDTERSHANNGIWLCQFCAKLIDNDSERFSVELLQQWKSNAEADAFIALSGEAATEQNDSIGAVPSIRWTKQLINSQHHDYRLEVRVANPSTKPIANFHIDLTFPTTVLNTPELHPLFVPARSSRQSSFFRYANTQHRRTMDRFTQGMKVLLSNLIII